MTEIIIEQCQKYIEIKVCGHSGYALHGTDIVCAAISILTYTFEKTLSTKNIKHNFFEDSSKPQIIIKIPYQEYAKTHEIINTIIQGYQLLSEEYPKNVKFDCHYIGR